MCWMLYCNIVLDIVQGFINLVPKMLLHVEINLLWSLRLGGEEEDISPLSWVSPPRFQTKFILTCNNISASQVQEATSEGVNFKTFLGEHTPRTLRSSAIHIINSFLSLTKHPAWNIVVYYHYKPNSLL